MITNASWATCSTPAAAPGTLLFNSTSGQVQFCKTTGQWHGLASAPAAFAFSPAQTGALAAWYRPESLSGYGNGAAINSWPDDSGNGHDLTPFGADAPTVTTSGIGGLKSLVIDSDNDKTKTSMGTLLQDDHTYYMVTQASAFSTDPYAPLLGYSDSAGTSNGGAALFMKNNGVYATYAAYGYGGTNDSFGTYTLNSPDIYAIVMDEGVGQVIYKNGTAITTLSAAGAFPAHATLLLSTQGGTGRFFPGMIAEVVLLSRASDQTEREKVEGYLAHKYGLTAGLPGGHPYKSVAP